MELEERIEKAFRRKYLEEMMIRKAPHLAIYNTSIETGK